MILRGGWMGHVVRAGVWTSVWGTKGHCAVQEHPVFRRLLTGWVYHAVGWDLQQLA